MVFIAKELALKCERMSFIDMRSKSPCKLETIVCLDYFDRERTEETNLDEEINTGSGVMVLIDELALDTSSNIDSSVLIYPTILFT